jgi:hypothetical protein
VTAESVALTLAAAALACWLGSSLAAAVGAPSCGLAMMALLASAFATLGSKLLARRSAHASGSASGSTPAAPFAGAEAVGGALMMLFFATIGASAGSLQALRGAGWLVLFILIQLG